MTSTVPTSEPDAVQDRRPDYRRTLARFPTVVFVIAVVLAVVVAEAGYLAYGHYKPVYQSVGSVSFDQPRELALATDAGIIQKLAQIRVQYAGLVKTDVIVGPVAQQTGLPPGLIFGSVVVSAPIGTLLLGVGARNTNPVRAHTIAQAVAQEIVTYVKTVQDNAGVPAKDQVIAQIVTPPQGAAKVAPTAKRRLSVAVVGGVLTFAVVFGAGALVRRRV